MIFIKLFLAHLIGDFLLQPNSWVAEKEQKKLRSNKLVFHALIHSGLMWLLLWDVSLIPLILIVTALHLLMDIVKLYAQKEETRRRWFFIDQSVHILILVAAAFIVSPGEEFIFVAGQVLESEAFWAVATAVIFLTFPSAIMIKMAISTWSIAIPDKNPEHAADGSLASAGKVIGILERLFVFVLVLIGQWHAIGFLLAAKSVFRFGDLKEMKDRKLTEYVLIGTLMSFGVALLTGMATVYFLGFD